MNSIPILSNAGYLETHGIFKSFWLACNMEKELQ